MEFAGQAAIVTGVAGGFGRAISRRLAHAAYTGGRLAGKGAVLHAHIGDQPEGLAPLQEVQQRTGIPAGRLVATHVNRNPQLWQRAQEYARTGGSIDITAMQQPETGHPQAIRPAKAILEALGAGVPAARLTLSSDTGRPIPAWTPQVRCWASTWPARAASSRRCASWWMGG